MADKIRYYLELIGRILERIMAIIVICAVIVAVVALWEPFYEFLTHRTETKLFMEYLDRVINIIIGIELFKMLIKPGAGTVLEVMMFCIARHMIVHDTTAVENLLTIIGVGLIFAIKKYFLSSWAPFTKKKGEIEDTKENAETD